MIASLLSLLLVALALLIIYYVVGMFVPNTRIMAVLGLILSLILLSYALRLFHVALP